MPVVNLLEPEAVGVQHIIDIQCPKVPVSEVLPSRLDLPLIEKVFLDQFLQSFGDGVHYLWLFILFVGDLDKHPEELAAIYAVLGLTTLRLLIRTFVRDV